MVATSGHNRNSPKKNKNRKKEKKIIKKKKRNLDTRKKSEERGVGGILEDRGNRRNRRKWRNRWGADGETAYRALPLSSAARDLFFVSVARGGQNPKREKQKIGEPKGRDGRHTRQVPATATASYEVTENIL